MLQVIHAGWIIPIRPKKTILKSHSLIIQDSRIISLIPTSYPGHSIITEDQGVIFGEDNCKCGRKGKYFSINGRLKAAEVRGCSDAVA